jgi:tRNA-dihydrouridine synthase C
MNIYLAPMEGVVDHHMRRILSRIGGIDVCVTEFVRVTDHLLPRKVFLRYSPELACNSNKLVSNTGASCPTRVQLLGSNPDAIAENARKVADYGAPGVDLNFGCPAKTVNRHRGGACLLNEPKTLAEIVYKTRQAVPDHIPVTAKIRLGYEQRNTYKENALAIFEAGANELVVHARSKADGYKPPAYWDCIGEIRDLISIPVIANGDIWNLEDYQRCRAQSKCRDIMLGRSLLSTPDLALAIKTFNQGQPYQWMTWGSIAELLLQFFTDTSAEYPTKHMGNRVKQWLF